MELRNLSTFRTVADLLSFTRAAEKLFMAQSSVSAQIKALEEELTVKLFDRFGRNILLTDAGQKLYDYARKMDDMTREIKSEISDSLYTRGSLTIRVPETIAAVYMPSVIRSFKNELPGVDLTFINCTDRQLKEELNTGRIDLAFLMTDAIHFADVNVALLKTENLTLVCSPSHDLAGQASIALENLEKRTLLLPKTD